MRDAGFGFANNCGFLARRSRNSKTEFGTLGIWKFRKLELVVGLVGRDQPYKSIGLVVDFAGLRVRLGFLARGLVAGLAGRWSQDSSWVLGPRVDRWSRWS